ncbi:glycosyltransferase family 4 protein [Amphritea sp. HPY]|uniref:glycosyltransferase family 4 protein n=1 Tax=Amphritea sp. HPY TaxID=3421652 RepID=UPI003D7CE05B
MITASIHIVRQFGPVGGMERYVWELTHALARQGQKVMVVCEKLHEPTTEHIEVVELGQVKPKPRWLAMLRFSRRVSKFFNTFDRAGWIIHSHERTAVHQVTTFHGPPILQRKPKVLDWLSPRIMTWEYLERRELCADNVQRVLPNSLPVAAQLETFYPEAAVKIGAPAYPGVDPLFSTLKKSSDGHTIGFIGKEWKRKGLDFAVSVISELRKQDSGISFVVAGPEPDDIIHLFKGWPKDSYQLLGWTRAEDMLPQIDLLIHPAKVEPFGMVMAEANATGIPVLISNLCGISPLISEEQGSSLPLGDIKLWAQHCKSLLEQTELVHNLDLTWADLAQQHIHIYKSLIDV